MTQTLKHLMLAAFVAVALLWGGAVHAVEKAPLMVPDGKAFLLSYQLDDKNDAVWSTIHDGVRAGRQVMVTHTVKLKKKGWALVHPTIVKKTWSKFIVYNLFENAYSYGANEKAVRRTTRPELVQAYVMSILDQPFVMRHKLESGEAYTITVQLEVTEKSEEESWFRYLPFQNIFKQTLTRSFTYVAP